MAEMPPDERAFLAARAANPDDPQVLLAYADWLDDRGDAAEAEFLRLVVAVAGHGRGPARDRLDTLRAGLDERWAALVESPVWAVAGNAAAERAAGPGGTEVRSGTRLFRPNAKLYLSDLDGRYHLFQPPDPWRRVRVVGQQRQSRAWVECWVRADYVSNWRPELVYAPGPKVRLRRSGWPGFALRPGDFVRPPEADAQTACLALLAAVVAASQGERGA